MLKVSEVYEKQTKEFKERPDGTEYAHFSTRYDSRDVLINKEYIVSVQPHEFTSSADAEKIDSAFPSDTKFSLLVMDCLLYTSPSPRDNGRSRMPSSA